MVCRVILHARAKQSINDNDEWNDIQHSRWVGTSVSDVGGYWKKYLVPDNILARHATARCTV